MSSAWVNFSQPSSSAVALNRVPDPRALAVSGVWDASGARQDVPGKLTFACENGAITKCISWGYKPIPGALVEIVIFHGSQNDQPVPFQDPMLGPPGDPARADLEAIARLNHAGYRVVVATNQSGVGRGLLDFATLNAIHDKMHRALAHVGGRIDAVFYCPHAADAHCGCRKPRIGLLQEISQRFNTPLKDVPSIGDSPRDLEASAAVGAKPILVLTGKGEALRRGFREATASYSLDGERVTFDTLQLSGFAAGK